ncbi:MAG: hypothetical protein HFG28_05340 [Eubacterium sp.]|nr:hypothetical protein [Eubacterium sp.]
MTTLFELREKLKNFYGAHEVMLRPIIKFIAVFVSLLLIKSNIGFMSFLNSWLIMLSLSVISAFLPWNVVAVILSADILANVFSVSIELGGLILLIVLILFLLFFRFSPKQGALLVFIPLAFFLKIPYAIPVVVGLLWAPYAIIPVIFGTIIYFMIYVISENTALLTRMSNGNISSASVNSIINMMGNNNEMVLIIIAFVITILVVYFIKRMSVDNAWTIAIFAGGILQFVIVLVGSLMLKTDSSLIEIIIGNTLSVVVSFIIHFFVFSVDYSRTEHTQFEDDEYYYYVKAVPKINVTAPEMNVKRINAQRRKKNQSKKLK